MNTNYKLTTAAIEILRTKEAHRAIEDFFEVKPRAVDNWISENRPNGPLMNINIRSIIAHIGVMNDILLCESDIYEQTR